MTEKKEYFPSESPQDSKIMKELMALLDTITAMVKVFNYQMEQTDSSATKIKLEKKLDDLDNVQEGLQHLSSILQSASVSEDDLLVLANSEIEALNRRRKQHPTERGKNRILESIAALEEVIGFIHDERQRSSLDWARNMLESYSKEEAAVSEAAAKKADQQDIERTKEKLLIREINQIGRGNVHTSIPKAYSLRGNGGFQYIGDKDWHEEKVLDRKLMDQLGPDTFSEHCYLSSLQETKYESIEVKPARKGIFGLGKRSAKVEKRAVGTGTKQFSKAVHTSDNHEQAYELYYLAKGGQYKDFSHRRGQVLQLQVVIPKSIADRVRAQMKKNPSFIRRLVKARMEKHFRDNNIKIDFGEVWENGDDATHGIPLKPPYTETEEVEVNFEDR